MTKTGEVADKGAIHDAFPATVAAAGQSPAVIATQDWSGLDAVVDALMDLLRTWGCPTPHNAGAWRGSAGWRMLAA